MTESLDEQLAALVGNTDNFRLTIRAHALIDEKLDELLSYAFVAERRKRLGRGVPGREAHRGALPVAQFVVCFAVDSVADVGLFDADMAKDRCSADVVAVRGVFDQLFLGQLEAFRDAAASLVDGSALLAMSIRR